MTINSYLFQKLCQHSNEQWHTSLQRLDESLNITDTAASSVQTIYLMLKDKDRDGSMLTSQKRHRFKSKRIVAAKIKDIIKAKQTVKRAKKQRSNVICEECGEKFKSNCHLIKHMKVHSNTRFPCKQCPKVFASKIQLDEHAERLHYPKKLQCPKCSKMFSTERLLKYHDKQHHITAICNLCFVQLPSKKALRAHLDKHDVNKCPRCNKSLINKHTYKFHLKICGIEEKTPNFFCDICNKGYARKNGLRTHLKTDHGFGNVLSCKWCGKKFDAVSRLRNHQVKHTKEKNYRCEQCQGKFVSRAALIYHIRLHTGERPFPCDLCNESFLSASRRMEHKRRKHFSPTKECHICHVKFVTGHQLKKHVQRHKNPQSKLFVPEMEGPYSTYGNIDLSANNNTKEQPFPSISKLLSM
ncbi:uncharacterized protein LOC142984186 isoform X2 [Anticarsia gemmatalis]